MGLQDRPAGRTSSLYLKPWPVRTFKDWHLRLYIVAASESDEGLVLNQYLQSTHTDSTSYQTEHFRS